MISDNLSIQIDEYDEIQLEKERRRLKSIDSFVIMDYIKQSVEILMNLKMEEFHFKEEENRRKGNFEKEEKQLKFKREVIDEAKKTKSKVLAGVAAVIAETSIDTDPDYTDREPPKGYERMLQKLESDIRSHIKVGYSLLSGVD